MDKIRLTNNIQSNLTIISNEFIDRYMAKADGEFVKIYLLLLRLMNQNRYTGPEQIADLLNLTSKDVRRAFLYWEKEGILSMSDESNAETVPAVPVMEETPASDSATLMETSGAVTESRSRIAPAKTHVPPSKLTEATNGTDLSQTIYMTQIYIGHPLSHNEIESFYYMEQELQFTADLLEFLIEYCVTKGKKSIRYMESVAIYWYEHGIDTVEKAKAQVNSYSENVFPIMKAFGISDRNPAPSELDYIQKWNQLGFDISILQEACNRTMLTAHQASFPYANRILQEWKKQGVRSLKDIQTLDQNFRKQGPAVSVSASASTNKKKASANAFHNFEQRSYDYDDIEARLINLNKGQ